jgi:ParB-like chromosome segregation protein Spo0J
VNRVQNTNNQHDRGDIDKTKQQPQALSSFALNNWTAQKYSVQNRGNYMSLRINPEYEKLLPKMSDEEFAELKASIQAEGQHYPIVANENLEILDGHHRFKACTELGIEPDFEVRKFENKLIEKKFVIEANLRRRHLTKFQLVELAVPLLEIEKALAKKRQVAGGKNGRNIQLGLAPNDAKPEFKKTKATAAVAKKIGVSTRTFERGKKILEKATEEEKQQLREGKASIAKIYREVVALEKGTEPTPKQDNATAAEKPINNVRAEQNKTALTELLEKLQKKELFCPQCGNTMLECSRCHKTLQQLQQQNNETT